MMSVREYAEDVGISIENLLELCSKLDIKATSEDTDIEEEELEIQHLEETKKTKESSNNNKKNKKKIKDNKQDIKNKKDFQSKRKEMYKHKEKLQSNTSTTTDDVIAYTEGMTVSELANALGVSGAEVIKKLMALGMMMTMNSGMDFDTAEIEGILRKYI